jgi:branched-chain amino acid transport system substrate-binding protein
MIKYLKYNKYMGTKMKKNNIFNKRLILIMAFVLLAGLFISGCSNNQAELSELSDADRASLVDGDNSDKGQGALNREIIFQIGAIQPLTGDGAAYGLPVQRVIDQAVLDLNAKWKEDGKKLQLKIYHEDGKCNGKEARTAAENLVNQKGVNIIYGGMCSGETLGIAPFTEENNVLLFSPLSSSPDITNSGDYVFRNYPSDTAQVATMIPFIVSKGVKTIAILSENTDYAQVLRAGYLKQLPELGVKIVADEIILSSAKDVRTEILKMKSAEPDAVILLPQTIPMTGVFAKQLYESNFDADTLFFSNEIVGLDQAVNEFGDFMKGYFTPEVAFLKENNEFSSKVIADTECDLGYYCASTYDGIFLLGDVLELCGDSDTDCLKKEFDALENWQGIMTTSTTFDENGDVAGDFVISQIIAGTKLRVN